MGRSRGKALRSWPSDCPLAQDLRATVGAQWGRKHLKERWCMGEVQVTESHVLVQLPTERSSIGGKTSLHAKKCIKLQPRPLHISGDYKAGWCRSMPMASHLGPFPAQTQRSHSLSGQTHWKNNYSDLGPPSTTSLLRLVLQKLVDQRHHITNRVVGMDVHVHLTSC